MNLKKILPVIHVETPEQGLRNAQLAHQCNADGVFIISHGAMNANGLNALAFTIKREMPGFWVGVNYLGLSTLEAAKTIPLEIDGLWTDNARIDERIEKQDDAGKVVNAFNERGWKGLYFGGVAFKYQRVVDDLETATEKAKPYMDVICTSGLGTGYAADLEKIKRMKNAAGDFPLAIASGVTPENINDYLPFIDYFLIATGISKSFTELDEEKLISVVNSVAVWNTKYRQENSLSQNFIEDTPSPNNTTGSETNHQEIVEWIEKGISHENDGEFELAATCYSKAAEMGSAPAMHFMGNLFFYNKIGKKSIHTLGTIPWHCEILDIPNYNSAFLWFLKAAELEFPLSMLNVGNLYFYGKGTEKDDNQSRIWLEKAMSHGQDKAFAAYYNFFGERKYTLPTDEQYQNYLNDFVSYIEKDDMYTCEAIMDKLILGTDKQLHKMGMMLAKGFCSENENYKRFNFARDRDNNLYAPVYPILRADWASTFIVNLDAFDEEYPVIGFTIDKMNCDPCPRKGLELIDFDESKRQSFGWLPENRKYCFVKANRNTELLSNVPEKNEWLGDIYLGQMNSHDQILDYTKENTAFFFTNPEKEYSVEIVHVTPLGEIIPILRYADF